MPSFVLERGRIKQLSHLHGHAPLTGVNMSAVLLRPESGHFVEFLSSQSS